MFSQYCFFRFLLKRNLFHQKDFVFVTRASLWTSVSRASVSAFQSRSSNNEVFTMKLDSPEFKSLFTAALCHIASLFERNNYEIRIAGGAVRDLLLGTKPKDVDFATTATPDQMKAMFELDNLKMINNKGEKHGTITARLDSQSFEITTLRIDVATDGRHAEVEFTTDWKLDASRRDLTINSMFLGAITLHSGGKAYKSALVMMTNIKAGLDGTVYDYFSGYDDLMKRKIVFVGDPDKRIKEDYLRILRYFRFYGRIADEPDNHDQECLKVIQENAKGLGQISGERIWLELQKIVVGNFSGDLLKLMHKVGLFPYLGLPENPCFEELDTVLNRTRNMKIHPITCISALLATEDEMLSFTARCKISRYERDLGIFIIRNRNDEDHSLIHYKKLILYSKVKVQDAREWTLELLKYNNDIPLIHEIKEWIVPKFPVSGVTLIENGAPGGKKLGLVIDQLKYMWAKSDCKLTPEEILELLPDVLKELGINKVNKQ